VTLTVEPGTLAKVASCRLFLPTHHATSLLTQPQQAHSSICAAGIMPQAFGTRSLTPNFTASSTLVIPHTMIFCIEVTVTRTVEPGLSPQQPAAALSCQHAMHISANAAGTLQHVFSTCIFFMSPTLQHLAHPQSQKKICSTLNQLSLVIMNSQ
jgi:hypothetical protein